MRPRPRFGIPTTTTALLQLNLVRPNLARRLPLTLVTPLPPQLNIRHAPPAPPTPPAPIVPPLRATAGRRLGLLPRVEKRQRLGNAAVRARAEQPRFAEVTPRECLQAGEARAYYRDVRFDDAVTRWVSAACIHGGQWPPRPPPKHIRTTTCSCWRSPS